MAVQLNSKSAELEIHNKLNDANWTKCNKNAHWKNVCGTTSFTLAWTLQFIKFPAISGICLRILRIHHPDMS